MQVKLSLQEKLKDERVNRHMTLAQLEEATGISRSTLGKYESDDCTDISPFNLQKLADYYDVSMDYLLGRIENKNHPNTALYELHLSDSMVDLLKSGKLNHRLLCELVTHPGFPRLLTDMEVCVDRIADMRVKDMNALLDECRRKIVEKAHPDENDLVMRTFELTRIDEEIFYGHVLHDDLDQIVRDIRTAHESDTTTADPDQNARATVEDILPMMHETLDYQGTTDERRAFLVCRMLHIDYNKLPDDEKLYFARVCRKSPDLINIFSQRGKIPSFQRKQHKGKKKR